MTGIVAIKHYFEADPHGRKVTLDELKELSKVERRELGQMACDALGQPYDEPLDRAA
jgi:hypothetical protein